jgi:hypothetical protein
MELSIDMPVWAFVLLMVMWFVVGPFVQGIVTGALRDKELDAALALEQQEQKRG